MQLADAEEQLQQAVRDKLQIQLELSQAQVGPKGGGGEAEGGGVRVFTCSGACVRVGIVWVGMAFAACLHEGGRLRKGGISGRKGAVWPLCGP